MVASLVSPALLGLHAATVHVEADLRNGIPAFAVVGLPDTAVQEARERVRSGIVNQAFRVPSQRIVVNLAPADLRKVGPQYDLPIALALLAASGQCDPAGLVGLGAAGELALDGTLRPLTGAIAMAEHAAREGWTRLMVPSANGHEAALVGGLEIVPISSLRQAVAVVEGSGTVESPRVDAQAMLARAGGAGGPDMTDIRGQHAARRALEIAAAGSHSMLMLGAPGAGKTMLARRLPGILPPMDVDEALEVTRIGSVAGLLAPDTSLVCTRPFRAPHHTVSAVGLVGGGTLPRPGEITLAHRGVLFLDEVCSFSPAAIDALREPLEEGFINVTRGMVTARFPARPLLVCAGNPCPCGYAGDRSRECVCGPHRAAAYRARLSGPIMDRIDLYISVRRLDAPDVVRSDHAGESTRTVRERVIAARARARSRGQRGPNGVLSARQIRALCPLDGTAAKVMEDAVQRLGLSARAFDRGLRVARTVADLAGDATVDERHLREALMFRMRTGEGVRADVAARSGMDGAAAES